MNKEYDRNNTGSLWKADKKTIKGETYYNGTLTIDNKDYSITMFKNNSDNPKAPVFRLKVNALKEESIIKGNTPYNNGDIIKDTNGSIVGTIKAKQEDTPYIDFGDTIELTDEIAF